MSAESSRRAKHTSVACHACRRARTKCSGVQPCAVCATKGIPCTFDDSSDMRRSLNRKRKVEELERDSELLNELLLAIRGSRDEQIAQVVSLIRSNAPIEEVKRCIKQQVTEIRLDGRERSPELEQLGDTVNTLQEQLWRKPLDIGRLTDEPPFRVAAAPWTSVTTDDTLVSNLISVWLTWDRPYYNWVHQELFLRDMKEGRLDCRYCSPFLVNALCASACFYSDYDEARAQSGVPSVLFASFLAEARRLHKEIVIDDNNRMTTAQGLAALMVGLSASGEDAVGFEYLKEATALCQVLDARNPPGGNNTDGDHHAVSDAVDLTCWGIFNVTVLSSTPYHTPSPMPVPLRPIPQPIRDTQDVVLYPLHYQLDSGCCPEILHYQSAVWAIAHEVLTRFYTVGTNGVMDTTLVDDVRHFHSRLEAQRSLLPAHLQADTKSPAPLVLLHATDYPCLSLLILGSLAGLKLGTIPAEAQVWAWDKRAKAALEIVEVCRRYNALYGNTHVNLRLVHSIFLALQALLDLQSPGAHDEGTPDDTSPYGGHIIDLCIFFRAMTRRFPWVMAAFRMFQVMAQQRGENALPSETKKLFEEFEKQDWEERELKRVISLYRNPLHSSKPGDGNASAEAANGAATMGDFFAQMEGLTIDDT